MTTDQDGNYEEGIDCATCEGSGERQEVIDGLLRVYPCSRCNGTGEIPRDPFDGDYEMGD
jgi:DnaJ-class molecular chaperone